MTEIAPDTAVRKQVQSELGQPVFAAAQAAADDLASAAGESVAAILFYGSCLRVGSDDEKILDFYVLCDDLAAANNSRFLGLLNHLLPPNVYYRETSFEGRVVRSKYALMSMNGFVAAMQPGRFNPSFWARFAQPAALAHARDAEVEQALKAALSQAVSTMAAKAAPMCAPSFSADALWARAFELTYRAELRAEDASSKGYEIFLEYADRYRLITRDALQAAGIAVEEAADGMLTVEIDSQARRAASLTWPLRMAQGKLLSLLRLMKAALTFSGGIDYLAWKIKRHSGVEIEVAPWQRRHPLIGGLALYLRHRGGGGFS